MTNYYYFPLKSLCKFKHLNKYCSSARTHSPQKFSLKSVKEAFFTELIFLHGVFCFSETQKDQV